MTDDASNGARTLVDELLAEQQRLTAVERFARRHESDAIPAQAKYYRDLIPLTAPQPGQQYAFEVNLDKCSGCKACVSACHSLNGLDDHETWREVGLLFSDDWRQPFQQTITTACHHCVDPGCLNGCPVLAYEKDPLTGIVRHLDDQCIGCQYCVMKCPYDVPKYSARRGIVRKCDMCAGRLAVGEAPACVQACPSEAIRITIVDQAVIAAESQRGGFLPDAPEPDYTLPATRYKSARPLPKTLLAGDHASVTRGDSHRPLVFMLVLTQLSVGASVAAVFAGSAKWLALIAAAAAAAALGFASLHLGRPLKAWRAFLGWRKSWFSREVIAFGIFLPLAAASALALWLPGNSHPGIQSDKRDALVMAVTIAAASAGLLGISCSAMIYADTHREFWRASQSFGKFFGTSLILGTALTLALQASVHRVVGLPMAATVALLFAATMTKLSFEHRIFRSLVDEQATGLTPLNRTARLLAGELGFAARSRIGCAIIGGMILPLLLFLNQASSGGLGAGLALTGLLFCVGGELLERYLFFTAVAPARMPGKMTA